MTLSGIIVIGGTRTAYLIDHNLTNGKIHDFDHYAQYTREHYQRVIRNFFDLGGTHLIVTVSSWQLFIERGAKYSDLMTESLKMLADSQFNTFYEQQKITPYFVGLEALLDFDNNIGNTARFLRDTSYPIRDKVLVFEIAPIPLLTWQMTDDVDVAGLSLSEMYDKLYQHYSHKAYGIAMPIPQFYLGSARNGIKLRAMYPSALTAGANTKYYFLPYPSIYLSKATLKRVIDDCNLTGNRTKSFDYDGIFNSKITDTLREKFEYYQDEDVVIGLTNDGNKKR